MIYFASSKEFFVLLPTDKVEVYKTIRILSSKKSVDMHGIRINVLKIVAKEISEVLSYLINFSFEYGIFPDILKRSIVVPVFKKRNPNMITNTSLLSTSP